MKGIKDRNRAWAGMAGACSVTMLLLAPSARAVEGVIPRATPQGADNLLDSVLNLGPFKIRPHALASVVYDDNIRISSDNRQEDLIWLLSPGVTVGAGDFQLGTGRFLTLDYTPTFLFYTDHDENSTVDHLLNLSGQYTWTKLTLGLAHSYQVSSGGLVEAGNRIDRTFHVTTLSSRYSFSSRTSAEANFRQTISDYDGVEVSSYNEWVNQDWINYQVSERIMVGAGASFAIRDVTPGPNETLQQVLVRSGYKVTEKIDAMGSAGVEFRQFQDSGSDDPGFIFSLGGVWRPRPTTEVSLEAYRQDQTSVVSAGQNYTATGLRAGARQAFRNKWSVTLGGGYQHADYRDISGGSTDREDDYWFVGPELSYVVNDRWAFGFFYQYRENTSNEAGFDFENNQVGLRSAFRF